MKIKQNLKTSTALHNLIYELGRNQQIQDEIYEEIKKICKKDEPLTEEILSKIPLLKASVKENLRFLFIQVFSLTSVN